MAIVFFVLGILAFTGIVCLVTFDELRELKRRRSNKYQDLSSHARR